MYSLSRVQILHKIKTKFGAFPGMKFKNNVHYVIWFYNIILYYVTLHHITRLYGSFHGRVPLVLDKLFSYTF